MGEPNLVLSTAMSLEGGGRKALGRGLAALIPTAEPPPATPSGQRTLPIEKVKPNRAQPRKQFDNEALTELAASIEEQGVLQPIVVRKQGDSYQIVAGERRWRAASRAGLHEIPAVIKDYSDLDALKVALVENIQRADLDPLEEAEAYSRLIRDHGLTQDQVARAVGKNRATVTNSLRLLKLPTPVLSFLADGQLTAGHARAVMTLDTPDDMVRLAEDVVRRRASVREAEAKARMIKRSAAQARTRTSVTKTPAEQSVEERLMRALGTKVRLRQRNGKGRLEISFHSLDQLDELLDKLAP